MQPRKRLLIFLFIVVNVLLLLIHLAIFKSAWPFAAWASAIAHFALLLIFPYQRIFAKS